MKILLNTGKEVVIDYLSTDNGLMVIKTKWGNSEELKNIFKDPISTKTMVLVKENERKQYENYTQFESIKEEKDGCITITMSQEGKGTLERLFALEKANEEMKKTALQNNDAEIMKLLSYQTRTLSDKEIVTVSNYVEKWDGNGKDYVKDDRCSFETLGEVRVFKVLQDHKSQNDWTPDTAHSLYIPIPRDTDGTRENPIEWYNGMESEEGKYYVEDNVLYIAIESSGIGIYGELIDLARYFEMVK